MNALAVPKHLLTRSGERRIHEGLVFDAIGHSWTVSARSMAGQWLCTRTDLKRQGYWRTVDIRAALAKVSQP
jgi:hypothetical protein